MVCDVSVILGLTYSKELNNHHECKLPMKMTNEEFCETHPEICEWISGYLIGPDYTVDNPENVRLDLVNWAYSAWYEDISKLEWNKLIEYWKAKKLDWEKNQED
jgi:hypothetical protein